MIDSELKELLRLGREFLERRAGTRDVDEIFSRWCWRLANQKSWVHPDALTFWKTYGMRLLIWCIQDARKKWKVEVEADLPREFVEEFGGDLRSIVEPTEQDRDLPDDEDVNDFVRWRRELPKLLPLVTPNQQRAIEKNLNGEPWEARKGCHSTKNLAVKILRRKVMK